MEVIKLSIVFLLVQFASHLLAYPTGAPPETCNSQKPSHDAEFQGSPSPFSITATSNDLYSYTVTIGSYGSNRTYEGFIISAFTDGGAIVGRFEDALPSNTQLICSKTAATHSSKTKTYTRTLTWNPNGYTGYFYFIATVVQSYSTYWKVRTDRKYANSNPPVIPTITREAQTLTTTTRDMRNKTTTTSTMTTRRYTTTWYNTPPRQMCYNARLKVQISLASDEPVPPQCMDANYIYDSLMGNRLYCQFDYSMNRPFKKRADSFDDSTADDLVEPTTVSPVFDEKRSRMMKAHGILLVLAWFVFASTSVLVNRYCKSVWPGAQICGKPCWIFVYYGLLLACLFLTLISFLIFIYQNFRSYSLSFWTYFSCYTGAYSAMFIALVIFLFIHEFLAGMKRKEHASWWWLYETFHYLTGDFSLMLAAAMILLSFFTDLYSNFIGDWPIWLCIAAICFYVLMDIILSAHERFLNSAPQLKLSEEQEMEMRKFGRQKADMKSILKTIFVTCYFFITCQLSVAICYGIATLPTYY